MGLNQVNLLKSFLLYHHINENQALVSPSMQDQLQGSMSVKKGHFYVSHFVLVICIKPLLFTFITGGLLIQG